MEESILELVNSQGLGLRVDAAAGVLRGVKILGLESRNGRSYLPQALMAAAGLYEGAKVNVNHPAGDPAAPRGYQDRIGAVRQVEFRPDAGLFGDFHFNPKHALAEQLVWDALHAPENVGFSHNVRARLARNGERVVVEAIVQVQSVDLVADPATTRGLFEQTAGGASSAAAGAERGALLQEVERLRGEVARLTAQEALHQRRELARRVLREHRLPDLDDALAGTSPLLTHDFAAQLLTAADEAALRRLVAERAALLAEAARHGGSATPFGPQSREQSPRREPLSTSDWVRSLIR